MSDRKTSSSNRPSGSSDPKQDNGSRKPFVEPELRCESDLIDGTAGQKTYWES